jgi:hypothetical protein
MVAHGGRRQAASTADDLISAYCFTGGGMEEEASI